MRESRKQEQKRKIHQIISKAGRVHVICARKERSNAQQEQGGGGKRKYLAANCSSRVRKGILEEVREVYTARQLRLQEEPSGQRDVLLGCCCSGGVVETRPRINTPAGSERERGREREGGESE